MTYIKKLQIPTQRRLITNTLNTNNHQPRQVPRKSLRPRKSPKETAKVESLRTNLEMKLGRPEIGRDNGRKKSQRRGGIEFRGNPAFEVTRNKPTLPRAGPRFRAYVFGKLEFRLAEIRRNNGTVVRRGRGAAREGRTRSRVNSRSRKFARSLIISRDMLRHLARSRVVKSLHSDVLRRASSEFRGGRFE